QAFDQFSSVDDEADRALFPSIYAWLDSDSPHGSSILMDDGRMFGRVVTEEGNFHPLESVTIIGDDIRHWRSLTKGHGYVPEHARRIAQTFGTGTYERLHNLRIAVVGCSGTGSPVIEQLARNSVGSLVLVDPDRVEETNLNRI